MATAEPAPQEPPFAQWCVLELMGHRRLGGHLTEQTIAGASFLRIDIPGEDDTSVTQLYSTAAVYAITPTTEAIARAVAAANQPQPVHQWELPARDPLYPGDASAADVDPWVPPEQDSALHAVDLDT